jgi:hypothetical protein
LSAINPNKLQVIGLISLPMGRCSEERGQKGSFYQGMGGLQTSRVGDEMSLKFLNFGSMARDGQFFFQNPDVVSKNASSEKAGTLRF